jgi:hypothetical protein
MANKTIVAYPPSTLTLKKRPSPLDNLFKEKNNQERKKLHYVAANVPIPLYEEFKKIATNQTRTINSAIIEAIKLYIKHSAKEEN